MRAVYSFNRDWLFHPGGFIPHQADDAGFQRVHLPHTNIELPHHQFDNRLYQFLSTYRKRFTLPEPLNGRHVFVDFDGAMISSEVCINGITLGTQDGGYVPFSFDLTPHLVDGENILTVYLDSTERTDIPPYGNVVDYLTFGGIYRDVHLRYVDPIHIADVFVKPRAVLSGTPVAETEITVRNLSARERRIIVYASIPDTLASASETVTAAPGDTVVTLALPAPGAALWSLDQPALYRVNVCLDDADSPAEPFDVVGQRFGFREAVFKPEGFFLNGQRIKLFGLNRHQTYPFIGGAAPARLQRKDAEILKYELGCNIVRTSHYPQSPHFIDRCDEIGLLVFEEIPGWQHIGDNDWKAISLRDLEAMIRRDRSHPSIVIWGVRINESYDDEAFYTATNALAHQLDPTRQTGGVRFFLGSQFLEDVYTYNDFSDDVIEPQDLPHLITEFNGHMFPTKSYDSEERQVEHALRHARIQNKQMGMANVTGAIGWCAFDYNTHVSFGAGDRVCYHGVCDIFRLPKFAADFYASQQPPTQNIILRPATFWTFGERAGAGVEPLYVFSNCDEIAVYKGGVLHGRYRPDREQFPHLPHPPFRVMGFSLGELFGVNYQELHIIGYLNGQQAAEIRMSADGLPARLELRADDAVIRADGSDMTRLVVRLTDQYGNRLPYHTSVIGWTVEGDPATGRLVGENPFPLVGGQAAAFIRAGTKPGELTIEARVLSVYPSPLSPARVTVRVE